MNEKPTAAERVGEWFDRAGWLLAGLAVLVAVAGLVGGLWMFLSGTTDQALAERAHALSERVELLQGKLAETEARCDKGARLERAVIELGLLELEWVGAPMPPELGREDR